MYYNATKDFDKSIKSFDSGVAVAKQIPTIEGKYTVTTIKYQKYFTYRDSKNFKAALSILLEYLKAPPAFIAHNERRIYFDLSETYAALGNRQDAYNWLKKYTTVNDSMNDAELKNDICAMEVKFQTAEKEKQILSLQKAKIQTDLSIKNNRLYNWLLGVSCLLLLVALVSIFLINRKNRRIAKQQITEVEQQNEIKVTQAMLEGEERERQRVARDLHDGLGGMLAGVKINLSRQSKMENQNLDIAINQLDQSVSELRRIARNMMPESLLKLGLEVALRDLSESMTTDKTQIEFQAYGIDKTMSPSTQANIYRIVQEILSNVFRHAEAKKVIIQCSQNEDRFYITAEDDGKGFDVSKISEAKGIGFSNIGNRVEYLKGKMDITSNLNEGTTINIELNVKSSDNFSHS